MLITGVRKHDWYYVMSAGCEAPKSGFTFLLLACVLDHAHKQDGVPRRARGNRLLLHRRSQALHVRKRNGCWTAHHRQVVQHGLPEMSRHSGIGQCPMEIAIGRELLELHQC